MPLRALFNPSLYSAPISTAKLVFKAPLAPRAYAKRAHSTAASASLPLTWRDAWSELFPSPSPTASPSACCPHPHPSFNADSNYWHLRRSPQLQGALADKFHEIEQLYLGNVSYRARMSQDNPGLLEGLALRGQRPPFMVVDCSDSRVNEGAIFDADPGTMFTAGNIANMFEEGDVSSNAVLTYAVGTLKVKHVVIMGHYGCGGVAASMAPLPEGYAERWLGHTTLPSLPSSPLSSHPPSSPPPASSEQQMATEETPADLAVQRWILPIRKIYETSGRPEIREHRERVQRLFSSPSWTRERIARVLMGVEKPLESEYRKREKGEKGESGIGEKAEIGEVKLHDGAFRALVEENVKANVWRLGRSRVIREHHEAYAKALSTSEPLHPVYVHGWVYDLETGVVSDLGVSAGPPGWVPPPGGVQGFPAMRGA
ncbi:carbonic anhydrase [Ephemerocybe angulata]|uniref:carbonic anhydrase n=1 Tax=Ephemerocybe angulata TaxID=980116 RepID=A0A8H6LW54_9AGAR|nr:carbonic anhydrase [Tulosesus angulatus]